jgi:DNA repair protein RecO (recombination protein O)
MEWSDEGIIIGLKPHGESAVILEAMTAAHGRHLGLVRGGRSQRMAPVLQPGNVVQLGWRARLDDHLGNYTVEALEMRAARFIGSAPALYGLNHLGALLRLLPEREPHPGLHAAVAVVTAHLDQPLIAAQLIIRFELQVLTELGFGLDLSACAATGQTGDLTFVSPKSGRAVSTLAAAPYRDRLLPLPSFLGGSGDAAPDDIARGFALTAYFLERNIYAPRGLPASQARASFVAAVEAIANDAPERDALSVRAASSRA